MPPRELSLGGFFFLLFPDLQTSIAPLHAGSKTIYKMKCMATKSPKSPEQPLAPTVRPEDGRGNDAVVLERRPQKTQPPQMYQVVLLNDDYTPMEFVVMVIQEFFNKDRETATQIMLKIHLDGKGVCGVFSKDVAATKVDQVTEAARKNGHPLQCVSEPIEL
jgi:ATP-dependent Clp protease adaptor protein ClpS